jgi:hypothetical protein
MQRHVTGTLGSPDLARPRALPDLSLDGLSGRGAELARRWAIAIILARPLAQMAEVALRELAREGAALCEQVLNALRSDAALDDLLAGAAPPAGERSAGEQLLAVAGGSEPYAVILAADALRAVLWQALWAELAEPQPRQLTDTADRLAHVCAMLAAGALSARPVPPVAGVWDAGAAAQATGPSVVSTAVEHDLPPAIVDERTGDAGLAALARATDTRSAAEEIAIHDQRGGEVPATWLDTISHELRRGGEHGSPFAVLLVQAGEREPRLRRSPADVDVDMAVRPALEPLGALTRERRGRYWLVVQGQDRAGAEALAERLSSEVARAASALGAAVQVAIGTASFPQDGREAAALAAHADVGLYAARAAARAAALRPPAGPGPPPYLPADPRS